MSKGRSKGTGINKKNYEETRNDPNQIKIHMTNSEREYFDKLASILSRLNVKQPDGTIGTIIPDKTLKTLIKSALNFMTHIYVPQIFTDSRIAANLQDKEALNEFVAFRAKYMNFPIDKQIEDLKRVGVVKSSSK